MKWDHQFTVVDAPLSPEEMATWQTSMQLVLQLLDEYEDAVFLSDQPTPQMPDGANEG